MAFCNMCGKEINDDAVVCVHCGCATAKAREQQAQQTNTTAVTDSSSVCWGFLGFCLPLVGFILWLVWKADTPLKAKSAGMGAR